MADTNIIGNLFGVSPELMQTQQDQRAFAQGMSAGSNPLGGVLGNVGMFSSRAGAGLRGALGVQSPEEQINAIRQQASTQFNTATPEGLLEYAQFLNQQGDAAGAQQAVMRAQAMAKDRQAIATSRAQEVKALREPDAGVAQLISKSTPESVAKYKQTGNIADLVLVKGADGEGGTGVAGPVGKSGAWRDADGIVYSAAEMKKQREGFQGAEKLLENLNTIKEADVKNAESWVDWTQGEGRKQVGGKVAPKTIAAQAKINASQLLKQIESLPPGSASNADMVAAKSSFPGYGDAKILQQWINDTKTLLQSSLARQSEQYGFKQRVATTPAAPAAGTPNSNNDPLGLRR